MNRALALFFFFPGSGSELQRSGKHIATQMLAREVIFWFLFDF